jgi:hypothetical protein
MSLARSLASQIPAAGALQVPPPYLHDAVVWGYWGIATPLIAILVVESVLRYHFKREIEEVLLAPSTFSAT